MKSKKFKSLLLLGVMGLFANGLFAQGIFFKFNAGYGFGMSGSTELMGNEINGTNSTTYETVNVSLGKGLNLGGAFGVMFNDNFGMELGLSYLLGGKTEAKTTDPNYSVTRSMKSNMLRVMPSLIVSAGFKSINPYAKFGLVIGAGSILREYNRNENSNISIAKTKANGGLALGLNSALGVDINMNDNFSLFGELNMINMSYAPTKEVATEATFNGADRLPSLTTSDKEFEYVDKIIDTQTPTPDSQPTQLLKQKLPFGSIGVNFGVKISF